MPTTMSVIRTGNGCGGSTNWRNANQVAKPAAHQSRRKPLNPSKAPQQRKSNVPKATRGSKGEPNPRGSHSRDTRCQGT